MTALPTSFPTSPAAASGAGSSRLAWRSAVWAAVAVTLARPATWVVALAGFLAGGGAVLLAWPILVLPTPSGIQNLLGAPVSTLAFGSPSQELVRIAVGAGATAAVLSVAGLLAGAWAERRAIGLVLEGADGLGYGIGTPAPVGGPADAEGTARTDAGAAGIARVALVRILALVPPLMVGAFEWPTLYNATYKELVLPEDLATPLPIRVVEAIPLLVAALVVVWLLADAAAAVGVRRLTAERRSVLAGWALGWADLARRPHRIIPMALLGNLALAVATGPALVASSVASSVVRTAIAPAGSPLGILAVALLVAVWLGSLVVAGLGAAVRSALFTMEGARDGRGEPARRGTRPSP